MGNVLDSELAGASECTRVRSDRHEFDETAQGVGSVKRSLRAAEDFDAGKIERIDVRRQNRAIGQRRRRSERSFVDIGRDRCANAAGVDAAKDDSRVTRLAFDNGRARNARKVIGQALRVAPCQGIAGNDRYRLRHVEQRLRTLLRSDDDGVRIALCCAADGWAAAVVASVALFCAWAWAASAAPQAPVSKYVKVRRITLALPTRLVASCQVFQE